MNQNRKCCILVDDAFVRSPLGIIKFVSNMIVKKREGFSLDGWTLKELISSSETIANLQFVFSVITGYNGGDQDNFNGENLEIDSKSL